MNIKSLLLGSAAALAAVSGARAADAVVVAEPEPMEYVRICDVYGAGFYYIPGTETCLRVGGYIRYDIGVGKGAYGGLVDVIDKKKFFEDRDDVLIDRGKETERLRDDFRRRDTYFKRARAALQLDARSETELGTLRGYMHINYNWDTITVGHPEGTFTDGEPVIIGGFTDTAASFGINHAYMELGGFRIGKTDSLFTTLTGYAGGVIADDLIPYGPFDTHQIAYTYTGGNGFSAAVALEEGNGIYTLDSYAPHVVAGASWTQGWGGVSGVVGYDDVFKEWAGKLRLDVNATDALSLFVMGGWGSQRHHDEERDDTIINSFYKPWNGKWAVWGGGAYKFNPKLTAYLQLSYAEGNKHRDEEKFNSTKNFGLAADVSYELVPGLAITPEVTYFSERVSEGRVDEDHDIDHKRRHFWGGFLRFQRSF
ncbi:porin [Mesorhizobium sp. KR1-2]|uniref:porin n=1 Tax=Mesorhizobium sp. KR1-2 TaxID=3156609 RepID=UPI0032B5CDD2